ncbi:hypothetical protein IFM89_009145 [Coptis chinensis]|uniref:NAC domain-containing protein n=1 Tax=Coptis chinensis TaxID=261450 RepID=A0A835HST3_9MAGN|nr:hypothetical protein IFM89_009145 [Coptis chinensis]
MYIVRDAQKKKKYLLKGTTDEYTDDEVYAQMCTESYDRVQETRKFKSAQTREEMKKLLGLGYSFCPSEGMLVDYYLKKKIMDELIDYCLIEEVDNVYAIHPQDLAGMSQVQYFFTSHPFELQSTDVKGRWIAGVKEDIVFKDVKVGFKQTVDYCEGNHKIGYNITEYQLCSLPENPKNGLWFICKLNMDGISVDELN